ncbi:glycosyltransferase [Qipengyuania sp. DY56-A-20]|jgi:glycosyltransferase involved in cell wall biosynthesis|uniref:Glycosyltransferase n=1 Tax=Qipengyuania benthica TaxID=3067651 RepID=A0ABT9H4Z9_9SPHN|nr:glycosyltransferase [Qipengyuania sp. DY56-A-20]MDP4538395.1 glycosyltransferase [Qipengyuania sp. DY56-A-20]
MSVTVLIVALDEERALPALVERSAMLDPRPAEILLVDGGSMDGTVEIARSAGWRVLAAERGRALQINLGVKAARSELVCVLHADTLPPTDMVAVIERTLDDPRTALASFTPVIRGPQRTRWVTTAHNWAKTWYAPLLTRPHLFLQGVRLLFGDHAMFFRRAEFLALGGCNPGDAVMEEADLCVKFATLGRIRMVPRMVETSDRRIAAWGPLKANWIYFKVGMLWAFGLRSRMAKHYPDVR